MNEKKHTPGTWKVQERKIEGGFVTTTHIVSKDGSHIAIVGPCNIAANACLMAEAGTIANETGKSLRQLADEHKELRDSLRELQDWCRAHASPVHNPEVLPIMVKAHTILEKTDGGEI